MCSGMAAEHHDMNVCPVVQSLHGCPYLIQFIDFDSILCFLNLPTSAHFKLSLAQPFAIQSFVVAAAQLAFYQDKTL